MAGPERRCSWHCRAGRPCAHAADRWPHAGQDAHAHLGTQRRLAQAPADLREIHRADPAALTLCRRAGLPGIRHEEG